MIFPSLLNVQNVAGVFFAKLNKSKNGPSQSKKVYAFGGPWNKKCATDKQN